MCGPHISCCVVTGVLVCIYISALPTVRHSYILYLCVYVCVSNGRARRRKETHPTIACYRCVRKRKRASSLANCSIAAAAWARRTTCLSPFVVQVTVLRADAVALWAICTPSKIGACARGSCSGRVAFVGCHVRPHDHHYVPRAHAGTAVTVSGFVGTLTCPDVLPICSPGVHDAPSDVNLTGTLAFSNAVYTFPLVAGARARGNPFRALPCRCCAACQPCRGGCSNPSLRRNVATGRRACGRQHGAAGRHGHDGRRRRRVDAAVEYARVVRRGGRRHVLRRAAACARPDVSLGPLRVRTAGHAHAQL